MPTSTPSPRAARRSPLGLIAALLALLALVAAACGGDDSGDDASDPTPTSETGAAGGDASEPDLSGVTIRVGDQADEHLRQILELSGDLDELPYEIEWSSFQNGPALIAAATGGSVDIGKLSETPVVFAQAAGSPVKVVYVGAPADPSTSSLGIVVAKDSDIESVEDLAGRKVAYAPGTVLEYLLANALDQAGLSLDDVTLVTIQPGIDLLASGDADAMVTGDPSISTGLAGGAQRLLVSGAEYTPGYYYLIARDGLFDDPLKEAAVADLLERIAAAEERWNADVDAAAEILAEKSGLPVEIAKAVIERSPVRYAAPTQENIDAHQAEIDFFVRSGVIEGDLDASAVFDLRFAG